MVEVSAFVGSAESADESTTAYPAGETHALLVYLRQAPGSDQNVAIAREWLEARSWRNVAFTRTGLVPNEPADPVLAAAYRQALEDGCAAIIYSAPVPK